jgi:hypothetical protein
MKAIKTLFLVLCVFSLCSKVVHHTYRQFHPVAVAAQ